MSKKSAAKPAVVQPAAEAVSAVQSGPVVTGRALVDLPAHGLRCGEFGPVPADVAEAITAVGQFDPHAVREAE